jgi:hypothetical protein
MHVCMNCHAQSLCSHQTTHTCAACVQGNCASVDPPSASFPSGHAPLRSLLPNQCLLLADHHLQAVLGGKLWLDSLYVRRTTQVTGSVFSLLQVLGSDAEMWMTGVTLQGNGDGMNVEDQARVYAEGAASARQCCRSLCLQQAACMQVWACRDACELSCLHSCNAWQDMGLLGIRQPRTVHATYEEYTVILRAVDPW